jgi:predicted negative regulator of RcsB-dependent stress response
VIFRVVLAGVLGLLAALSLAADVLVLKSGRRIEAWNIEERGDRVYYETPNGSISLPKRVVVRIERSDAMPRWGESSSAPALDLPPASLPALGDEDVLRVVADGEIDGDMLAQLEQEANASSSEAVRSRAAAAHVLVARQHFERNQLEAASESLSRALRFAPDHPAILLNLAAVEFRQQRFGAALDHLRPALESSDYGFDAYRLQGYIYYQREEMDRALAAWKQALAIRSDLELEGLVAQAEREAQAVERYQERGTGRFLLRYEGGELESQRLAASILGALDSMYDSLAGALNVDVREPIVVILHPSQTFYDLTGMPPEVHGLFDGKIRVPLLGLSSLTPRLEQTLRHELTHALVYLKAGGRVPRWVQEGLAQYHAGQTLRVPRESFRPLFEPRDGSVLPRIEASFQGNTNQVLAAYAGALLVVDTLQRRYGRGDMERFLEALARGQSDEQALNSAFRLNYVDLEREVYDAVR